MKKMFILLFFLISVDVYGYESNSSIYGEWSGLSNNNEHVFSLNIVEDSKNTFLSYVFIFQKGRKINDASNSKILLVRGSDECWNGVVYGLINKEKAKLTLCKNKMDNLLTWEIDKRVSYVPKHEIFKSLSSVE
ncbi:MAG: hypothetical protein ACK5NC_06375 [Vibrio sp.]